MADRMTDSWLYMMEALAERQHDHDRLLLKDPYRLGWSCQLTGCGFFKPAEEFDGLAVFPCSV